MSQPFSMHYAAGTAARHASRETAAGAERELFFPKGLKRAIHAFVHGDVLQEPCDAENIVDLRRRVA